MDLEPDYLQRSRPLPESVTILERLTRAEVMLVHTLRARAVETHDAHETVLSRAADETGRKAADRKAKLADTCAALNSDFVFHVARFFFLMRVLDCQGESQMAAFIVSHNERLETFRLSDASRNRSPSELEKAEFSNRRTAEVLDTLRKHERFALATGEVADFLFEHGSRKRINEAVNVLLDAGLLIALSEDQKQLLPRPSRLILQTDNYLEGCYERYLLAIEGRVQATNPEGERA